MLKKFKRIISIILVVVLTVVSSFVLNASGASESQLRNEISKLEQQSKEIEAQIKKLKGQNADQQAIVNAIEKKIANTQQQINACNAEISRINSRISANKAEIDQKNKEIAETKNVFKKRLRAIYMNNTESSIQILLGAEDFSDYLQLQQLTEAVSAHDKQIIDDIVATIEVLEEKQVENEKLLNDQVSVKNSVLAKQKQLQADVAEANSIINKINSQTNTLTQQNKNIEAEIKRAQNDLNKLFSSMGTNSNINYDGKGFFWPVPSCYTQTTYAGHTGIDIPGSYGANVIASADGVVLTVVTGHGRNPGASGLASYGNYIVVDHGNRNGTNYKTYYAHLSGVAVRVGQSVKQGQVIGYVGNSGNTWGRTGTHLHFELRINNGYVNPNKYLRKS